MVSSHGELYPRWHNSAYRFVYGRIARKITMFFSSLERVSEEVQGMRGEDEEMPGNILG